MNNSFNVPLNIIDQYLPKLTNGALTVYLYLLKEYQNKTTKNIGFYFKEIAETLGLDEAEFRETLLYLCDHNLIDYFPYSDYFTLLSIHGGNDE